MMDIFRFRGPATTDPNVSVAHYEHERAIRGHTTAHGRAIRKMLEGWADYASAHELEFGERIGDDGVLGPYWAGVGLAIVRFLDGPVGGFDCGSIDWNVRDAIIDQGLKVDE